jgi:hypothetical protein
VSIFVGQHEGEGRFARIAGADVEFEGAGLPGDGDLEEHLAGVAVGADRKLRQHGDVVHVLARSFQGFFDDRPNRLS